MLASLYVSLVKYSRPLALVGAAMFMAGCTSISTFSADTLGDSQTFTTWTCALANEVLLYSIGLVIVSLVAAIIIFALSQYGGALFQMFGAQPPNQQLVQSVLKGTLAFMLLPALISVVAGLVGGGDGCAIGG